MDLDSKMYGRHDNDDSQTDANVHVDSDMRLSSGRGAQRQKFLGDGSPPTGSPMTPPAPGSPTQLRSAFKKGAGHGGSSPFQSFIRARTSRGGTKTKMSSSYDGVFKPSRRKSTDQHFAAVRKAAKELRELKAQNEKESYEQEQQDQEVIRKIRMGLHRLHRRLSAISLLSILTAIWINEVCSADDYSEQAPPEAVLLEIEEGDGRLCPSAIGNPLKILQTVLTLLLLYYIVRKYVLRLEKKVAKRWMTDRKIAGRQIRSFGHVPAVMEGGEPGSDKGAMWVVREGPTKMKCKMLIELLIFSVHAIPFYENDYKVELLGTKVFYRFESIICCTMMLRLYHIWKWIYLTIFLHYFDTQDTYAVQDAATIDLLRQAHIRKHMLAVKVVVARRPLVVILVTILTVILTGSYLLRIAEGPAYQPHSIYFWDQMWIAITQGTTGYGGSEPKTHMGRFVSVIMMFSGPIFVAFVTATVTRFLSLSAEESSLVMQMDKNHVQREVLQAAAMLIQFSWRVRRQSKQRHLHAQVNGFQRQLGVAGPPRVQRKAFAGGFGAGAAASGGEEDLSLARKTELWRNFYMALDRRRKLAAQHRSTQGAGSAAGLRGSGAAEGEASDMRKLLAAMERVEQRVSHVEEGVRLVRADVRGCPTRIARRPSTLRWSLGQGSEGGEERRDAEELSAVLPPRCGLQGSAEALAADDERSGGGWGGAAQADATRELPGGAGPTTSIKMFLPRWPVDSSRVLSAETRAESAHGAGRERARPGSLRAGGSAGDADEVPTLGTSAGCGPGDDGDTLGSLHAYREAAALRVPSGSPVGSEQAQDEQLPVPPASTADGALKLAGTVVRADSTGSLRVQPPPEDEVLLQESGRGSHRKPRLGRQKQPLGGWETELVFSKEPRSMLHSRRRRAATTPPPRPPSRANGFPRSQPALARTSFSESETLDEQPLRLAHAWSSQPAGAGARADERQLQRHAEASSAGRQTTDVSWSLSAPAPALRSGSRMPSGPGAADLATTREQPADGRAARLEEPLLEERPARAGEEQAGRGQGSGLHWSSKRRVPMERRGSKASADSFLRGDLRLSLSASPITGSAHLAEHVANWARAVREASPAPHPPTPSPALGGPSDARGGPRKDARTPFAVGVNPREPTPGLLRGEDLLRGDWELSPPPPNLQARGSSFREAHAVSTQGGPSALSAAPSPLSPVPSPLSSVPGQRGIGARLDEQATGGNGYSAGEQRARGAGSGSRHDLEAFPGPVARLALPRTNNLERARAGADGGGEPVPVPATWTPRNGQGTPRNEARRWTPRTAEA